MKDHCGRVDLCTLELTDALDTSTRGDSSFLSLIVGCLATGSGLEMILLTRGDRIRSCLSHSRQYSES